MTARQTSVTATPSRRRPKTPQAEAEAEAWHVAVAGEVGGIERLVYILHSPGIFAACRARQAQALPSYRQ